MAYYRLQEEAAQLASSAWAPRFTSSEVEEMERALLIATAMLAVLTLAMHGYIQTAEEAAFLLVGSVVLIALGVGGLWVRFGLFALSLFFFLQAVGDEAGPVLLQLLELFGMLIGFYVIFRGLPLGRR